MTDHEAIDKAVDESLTLLRAFRLIIDLPKEGPQRPDDQPPESFADIEDLIHKNHVLGFWSASKHLESPERQAQGPDGLFAHYIYKSTLPFPPELYKTHIETLETKLEEMRGQAHAYLLAGRDGECAVIRNELAEFNKTIFDLRVAINGIAKYAVDTLSEIPAHELVEDIIASKLPEASIFEKNGRINRRKDVLQTLTTAICDNVADIKKILGIESAKRWSLHEAETESGPESGVVPGAGNLTR